MTSLKGLLLFFSLFSAVSVYAVPRVGAKFDRIVFVIFENKNYSDVMRQPFFRQFAASGAHFTSFKAITHPSQGNYVALTSGSLNGVKGDGVVDINTYNIVDLLEAKRMTWKIYAENYPGNCFTGKSSGDYVRKHNPFISYLNIQKNPVRCANIVDSTQFDRDASSGTLPNYIFYIPNMKNDGHDTNVAYADKWFQNRFLPFLTNQKFMQDTIVISTFDESELWNPGNQIYATIVGPMVKPGNYNDSLNLYSLLKLVEDNFGLGNLGKNDLTARPIPNIWK